MKIARYIIKSYFAFKDRDIELKDPVEKNLLVNFSGILVLLSIPILKLKKKDSMLVFICAFFSILADGITFSYQTNVFNVIDRWTSTIAFIIITKNFFRNNNKNFLKSIVYIIHVLISGTFLLKSKKSVSTKEYNKYHAIWHFYGIGVGNIILFLFKDL